MCCPTLPPFLQHGLFFTHTIAALFSNSKNFLRMPNRPLGGSAANVLHVIERFHVIIIHRYFSHSPFLTSFVP